MSLYEVVSLGVGIKQSRVGKGATLNYKNTTRLLAAMFDQGSTGFQTCNFCVIYDWLIKIKSLLILHRPPNMTIENFSNLFYSFLIII